MNIEHPTFTAGVKRPDPRRILSGSSRGSHTRRNALPHDAAGKGSHMIANGRARAVEKLRGRFCFPCGREMLESGKKHVIMEKNGKVFAADFAQEPPSVENR